MSFILAVILNMLGGSSTTTLRFPFISCLNKYELVNFIGDRRSNEVKVTGRLKRALHQCQPPNTIDFEHFIKLVNFKILSAEITLNFSSYLTHQLRNQGKKLKGNVHISASLFITSHEKTITRRSQKKQNKIK